MAFAGNHAVFYGVAQIDKITLLSSSRCQWLRREELTWFSHLLSSFWHAFKSRTAIDSIVVKRARDRWLRAFERRINSPELIGYSRRLNHLSGRAQNMPFENPSDSIANVRLNRAR